jgi:hypothetical protein
MKTLLIVLTLLLHFHAIAQELVGYSYGYDSATGKEKIIIHELNLLENNTFSYQTNESINSECKTVYAGHWLKKKNSIKLNFIEGDQSKVQFIKKKNLYLWRKENQELTLYLKPQPENPTLMPKEKNNFNFTVSESRKRTSKKDKPRKEPDCPKF